MKWPEVTAGKGTSDSARFTMGLPGTLRGMQLKGIGTMIRDLRSY